MNSNRNAAQQTILRKPVAGEENFGAPGGGVRRHHGMGSGAGTPCTAVLTVQRSPETDFTQHLPGESTGFDTDTGIFDRIMVSRDLVPDMSSDTFDDLDPTYGVRAKATIDVDSTGLIPSDLIGDNYAKDTYWHLLQLSSLANQMYDNRISFEMNGETLTASIVKQSGSDEESFGTLEQVTYEMSQDGSMERLQADLADGSFQRAAATHLAASSILHAEGLAAIAAETAASDAGSAEWNRAQIRHKASGPECADCHTYFTERRRTTGTDRCVDCSPQAEWSEMSDFTNNFSHIEDLVTEDYPDASRITFRVRDEGYDFFEVDEILDGQGNSIALVSTDTVDRLNWALGETTASSLWEAQSDGTWAPSYTI
jgi:hypothetical protein